MPSVNGRPKHILLIQGHPDPTGRHFCHALAAAYETGAVRAGHEVEQLDITNLQFPFVRSRADLENGSLPESIRQAHASLLRADHIVLCFPIWNGGMPAIVRAFFEQTFRSSFVFPDAKPGEKLGFTSYFKQRKALAGKTARTIVTMTMPAFVYRWYFHPHLEKNSLKLSGLTVRESLVGGADSKDARVRERWLTKVAALGRAAK
jgi:putative NADPH-quinone reductase